MGLNSCDNVFDAFMVSLRLISVCVIVTYKSLSLAFMKPQLITRSDMHFFLILCSCPETQRYTACFYSAFYYKPSYLLTIIFLVNESADYW